MIKLSGIDHIVLRVSDIGVMEQFYCDVIGCVKEREKPEIGLYQYRAGVALIDMVTVDGKIGAMGGPAPGIDARNMDHFCLAVADFNEADVLAHLAQHGIHPSPAEMRYGAGGDDVSIYLNDPEGNQIELRQAAKSVPN